MAQGPSTQGPQLKTLALVFMFMLDIALLAARVFELVAGHEPTTALTLAFGTTLTATVGVLTAILKSGGNS